MHFTGTWSLLVLTTLPSLPFAQIPQNDHHYPATYIMREAEAPTGGNGLSVEGAMRGECLRDIFGIGYGYNFTFMMAPKVRLPSGKHQRPRDTIAHLALDYGLEIDQTCKQNDVNCVANVLKSRQWDDDVLLCWHPYWIPKIVRHLGVTMQDTSWPSPAYNTYWRLYPPYDAFDEFAYECPGLKGSG